MLDDNGICAIDEFDKMTFRSAAFNGSHGTATISIAKAGICHFECSYINFSRSQSDWRSLWSKRLRQNIAMTAPIMSRFDLFFCNFDECNESGWLQPVRHILNLHRYKDTAMVPHFSREQVKRYLRYCRMIARNLQRKPLIWWLKSTSNLDKNDMTGLGSSYRVTVRQLESLIRLSEALARLHADPVISVRYVREAARLLKASIIRVESDSIELWKCYATGH